MNVRFLKGYPIQILSSFIVSLGIFSFGLGHVWVAPAVPKLLSNNGNCSENTFVQIDNTEASWIASISLMTLPFCSIGTIFLANYFGTKNILMTAPIPLIISWILIYFAQNVWYYYISRLLVSLADALYYGCGPAYIGEISDPKIRGGLLFLIPTMLNFGSLISYYFGYVLSIKMFACLSIIPAVIYLILFIGMPHSPYYFMINKKYDKAEDTLRLLRGKNYIENETEILKNAIESEISNKINIKTLLNNIAYRKSFTIVLMMMLFQNLSGSTVVTSYLHFIINESNINISTDVAVFIAGAMTVFGNLCSAIWIDRKGRRPLILISMFTSGVLMTLLGVCFYLKENKYEITEYRWVPCAILTAYQFFINLGMVNMGLVLAGELFATNMKNYGISVGVITYGIFGFATNKLFLITTTSFGMSCNFFTYGIFSFIGYICYYSYIPETRHKSLIEIQEMLRQ